MDTIVGETWWTVVVRGIVAVLFGFAALIWPAITLFILILLFGAFVLITGAINVFTALSTRETNTNWGWLLASGIVGVLVGIAVFVWPGITGLILLFIIAFWALATGVLEIIAAFSARAEAGFRWLLAIVGGLSVVFGLLLLVFPGAGALGVITLRGAFAIVYGILLVILGFQLRAQPARPA